MRPAAATRPAATGTTSAVVLPTSIISASACSAATAIAPATQLAAATSCGRSRATAGATPAGGREDEQRPAGQRGPGGVEDEATPSRLVRKASEAPRRRGQGDGLAARRREPLDDLADHRLERRAVVPHLVRARDGARLAAVAAHGLRVRAADVEADHAGHARRSPAMRVIPVIDLKGGAAVHAVRGERERYRPLDSTLAAGSDPVEVARAVRDALGLG